MKLLYPTSIKLDLESHLRAQHPDIVLVAYDPAALIPAEHLDATVLVAWTNSAANLAHAAAHMPALRWVQSLAAGPNDVLAAGFDRSRVAVTSGSGLHNAPVAEHALGLLLNAARRFYEMRDHQARRSWAGHLRGDPTLPGYMFSTLRGANVVIWGYGNIAKTLAPHLTALGATVRGVARSPGVRDGVEVFAEEKLPELLRAADALVMILPGSEATRHALNAERIAHLSENAWVVNVGRGTSVDEAALVDALEKRKIGGAALDVFEEEPLPASSKLWDAPNLILSPHAAGNRPLGSEVLIAENLELFLEGKTMTNTMP
ncbi:NAD(P)-binding domain protein [Cordyceps fumosorosea ARSEF 2679]|uniref:NAD(P)-binding domain protein n=1 Tax=Cordyceps fumosorosea (strain ARSEF 2679) TaxID=1081104 RepID=A0A168CD69_CORFA|nr:NAD(P)-binding domain protein [Cordyceps fumosorosea ARSEF 2679]OAA71246.1 NAD(P)-binding domain protein [Cordyceps fumosorosea ARSEF 2679]